jgi:hypothetical protein
MGSLEFAPPYPCCGGLTWHRGGPKCDEYKLGPDLPQSARHAEAKPLPPIWDLVIADMHERDRIGAERYGDRLRTTSPNDPLRYAYEEALDLACYLRQAIAQRDGK